VSSGVLLVFRVIMSNRADSYDCAAAAADLRGEVFARRVITVVLGLITARTFTFGFGHVWVPDRALVVLACVAPLAGLAVDLWVPGPVPRFRQRCGNGAVVDLFCKEPGAQECALWAHVRTGAWEAHHGC
jgi:hypothetical protein